MIRLGVTGTDTGVGKTVVSCALTAALVRRGMRVAAMKPVETGMAFDDPDRDGARLARAAKDDRLEVVAPLTYPDPVAPLVAGRRAHRPVDLERLDASFREASRDRDVIIVEGAGGILVPITDRLSYDGLFARWALAPIIVAANRLGVINHVRLTIAAARAAGLEPRAVVLNAAAPTLTDASLPDNARVIADLERVPVCELPWLAALDDLDRAADAVEDCGLVALAVPSAPEPVP